MKTKTKQIKKDVCRDRQRGAGTIPVICVSVDADRWEKL